MAVTGQVVTYTLVKEVTVTTPGVDWLIGEDSLVCGVLRVRVVMYVEPLEVSVHTVVYVV